MSFNLAAHVLAQAQSQGDRPALEVLSERPLRISYATLEASVLSTAQKLLDMGLKPGISRVLFRLGNSPDFPILYLACIAVDLLPIPTSTQLTPPEVARIIDETAPALIVHDPDDDLPKGPYQRWAVKDLHLQTDGPQAAYRLGDPERPAYIIYTSGTSGQPRAVVHAHRAILARRTMWDGWYGLRPDDRLLHAGAFNWTYTLGTGLMDPWTIGATALIPAQGTEPAQLGNLLAKHRATIFAASPGVYRRMLRGRIPATPHLRHGLSAGEKLPDMLRAGWTAATGTPLHEAYGMSECSTFISGAPSRPAPPDTLGFVQPGRKVQLMPDTGIIAIHRDDPGLMLGYLDQPAETAAKFAGEWFQTGDIGKLGPEGAIIYAGRADDMMNAGGTRVSPVEVENALSNHPDIEEIAAAEVRLRTDLSLIAAFYTAHNLIDENDLANFARARLADYKVPRIFVRVDQLPRGTNNKLLRHVLRRDWEAQHGEA